MISFQGTYQHLPQILDWADTDATVICEGTYIVGKKVQELNLLIESEAMDEPRVFYLLLLVTTRTLS